MDTPTTVSRLVSTLGDSTSGIVVPESWLTDLRDWVVLALISGDGTERTQLEVATQLGIDKSTPLDDALSAWSSAQCDVAGSVIGVDKHNELAHVFDVPTISAVSPTVTKVWMSTTHPRAARALPDSQVSRRCPRPP